MKAIRCCSLPLMGIRNNWMREAERRERRTFTASCKSDPAFVKSSCQRPFWARTERASGESMTVGSVAYSRGVGV